MNVRDIKPGMAVVYAPKHGKREDGVVTKVGDTWVHVRFAGQHPDADGKACLPWDLEGRSP